MLLKLISLAMLPFVFAMVALMRLLSPLKLIRIGEFWNGRIGHLIGNTECYLCEIDAGMHPKSLDLWFAREAKDCNTLIGAKYRKLLHIFPRKLGHLVKLVNGMFPGWQKHICEPVHINRDIFNLWKGSHIGFTKKEEALGLELLKDMGIPENSKWVCLIVRDSAYLKREFPETDWSYHDYRDADIDNYLPAAKALTQRGYYVLRMGAVAAKQFFNDGKIIDYANSIHRSEFGDLYLGSRCAFALGTQCGFMSIPQSFQRPVVVTDMVPLEDMESFWDGLIIWKHHWKNGKEMTTKEILDSGASLFNFKHMFEQAGITLKDNTPLEIKQVAMEMCNRMVCGVDGEEPQEFWKTFPNKISPFTGMPMQGQVIRMRVGREFLKGCM